jgi:hypothetical protein
MQCCAKQDSPVHSVLILQSCTPNAGHGAVLQAAATPEVEGARQQTWGPASLVQFAAETHPNESPAHVASPAHDALLPASNW